jgi:hypothetical protein
MIVTVKKPQIIPLRALTLLMALGCATLAAAADQKPSQLEKPLAGPRATALRVTWLYVTADTASQKVARVQIGREMVVAETSGPWMRVYANTDMEEMHEDKDAPIVGDDTNGAPPPISGWLQAKGIVEETTPDGDQILMGAAAGEEADASDPRGPVNAAQSARLLYRRLAEMFPNSPLVSEAAWRSADIQWQLDKADVNSMRSSKSKDPYMRQQIDEDALRKVMKQFAGTRWADLAAYDLIDNKLCGDWQGSEDCPAKETEIYEKYAKEHPNGTRTAQALYLATYRQAVLKDMLTADGSGKKAGEAKSHAEELAARLKDKFPASDYAWRAEALVFKLEQGIPVYGIDQE